MTILDELHTANSATPGCKPWYTDRLTEYNGRSREIRKYCQRTVTYTAGVALVRYADTPDGHMAVGR